MIPHLFAIEATLAHTRTLQMTSRYLGAAGSGFPLESLLGGKTKEGKHSSLRGLAGVSTMPLRMEVSLASPALLRLVIMTSIFRRFFVFTV